MRIKNRINRLVSRWTIRLFPFIFKSKRVTMLPEEADTFLDMMYPDVKSSCWSNNKVDDNPEYDLHIIVSAYNVEKYINQCIDSILNQETQYKFWITIVNDGSTDTTRDRLKKYENLSNVSIIDQSNKGYSGARNVALNHIKGRYLMFVDSDDFLAKSAIETLMNKGYAENADIVQGSYNNIDENNNIINKVKLKNSESSPSRDYSIISAPWGKIFNARLFKDIQFPDGYWYEDTITKTIIIPASNSIITLSEIVYNYRHHNGTVIKQNKNPLKEIDSLYVTRSLFLDYISRYKIDEYINEHFMNQGRFVYVRMNHVQNPKIKLCTFVVLQSLYEQYLKPLGLKSKKFPIIQKAFEEKDYKLYCLGCRFST